MPALLMVKWLAYQLLNLILLTFIYTHMAALGMEDKIMDLIESVQ